MIQVPIPTNHIFKLQKINLNPYPLFKYQISANHCFYFPLKTYEEPRINF